MLETLSRWTAPGWAQDRRRGCQHARHHPRLQQRAQSLQRGTEAVSESSGLGARIVVEQGMRKAAQIANLLVAAFRTEEASNPAHDILRVMKLVADLQLTAVTASTRSNEYVTVLAYPPASDELLACACLSPGLFTGGPPVSLHAGRRVATVTNMAVKPAARRRGLGAALLRKCEAEAARLKCQPEALALTVYRSNEPARRLYERSGFVMDEEWEDPRWVRSAEAGRTDVERRYLMLKPLAPAAGSGGGPTEGGGTGI